jgi:hypothetical protein
MSDDAVVQAPPTPVDMSPDAIAERIATVGQLYRVCMSLAGAKRVPGSTPAPAGTPSKP